MNKYGMRLRGYAPMCQPKEGLLFVRDDPSGKYWNILIYDRPLTDKELRDYELDRIPGEGDTMKQNKMSFAEWLEAVIGITWEEWDNSYSGIQMEQIESEYDEYWDS